MRNSCSPVVVLLVTVAVSATAAPAPVAKPSRPWLDGWDEPADPVGDCRFDRKGDRLAVTVPGKGHYKNEAGKLLGPALLKEVEGDFAVEVRVGGNFMVKSGEVRRAGIVLMDGTAHVMWLRHCFRINDDPNDEFSLLAGTDPANNLRAVGMPILSPGPSPSRPAFIRLERRGNSIVVMHSENGRMWKKLDGPMSAQLGKKLRVGVIALSTAEGVFEPVFDRFKLEPLK